MEALEREEKQLAVKLQAVCTPYGDERESKLSESSEILFSMGRLYVKKAEAMDGMDQKLNYIKAATLLHGARVRFGKFLKETKNWNAVFAYILLMEKSLLEACKVSNCGLMEISNNVARRLKLLRKIEKSEMKKLEIIPDIPKVQAVKKQIEKINQVEILLKKNTTNFKHLIGYIAEKCLQILGHPPCHFTIAGLGSLSRNEITLYSDFEHVIILDEGVKDLPEYTAVQEYFRWFAVLFQVIIIGLGETMIPSVGVKSLNDLRYKDKFRNWFFDAYTPSGVCVDGMMPHACKTPIGRQEPTANKSHVVELIQQVSKMSSYLSLDEGLKNGYHLQDMLRQACFVYGSQKVFNYFQIQAHCTLQSQDVQIVIEQISILAKENVNINVCGSFNFGNNYELNAKILLYRPLSALRGYLARVSEITSSDPCFEFLPRVLTSHRSRWALAVACEVRMKVYSANGGSRGNVLTRKLTDFIGTSCVTNCLAVIEEHSKHMKMCYNRDLLDHAAYKPENEGLLDGKSSALFVLGRYQEAKKVLLREQKFLVSHPTMKHSNISELLAWIYFEEAGSAESERVEKDLPNMAKGLILSHKSHERNAVCLQILHQIHSFEGRHREALKIVESLLLLKVFQTHDSQDFKLCTYQVRSVLNFMSPEEVIEYCQEKLSKHVDVPSQLAFQLGIAVSRIKFDKEEGRKDLCKLVDQAIQEGTKFISKSEVLKFLNNIFCYQLENSCHKDAYVTLEKAWIVHESRVEHVPLAEVAQGFANGTGVSCCLTMVMIEKDISKRKKMLDKVVAICQMPQNVACNEMHCIVIAYLFRYAYPDTKDFGIEQFSKYYHNTPVLFRHELDVFVEMMFRSVFYRWAEPSLFDHNFAVMSNLLMSMLEKFSSILVHPHVIRVLYRVFKSVVSQLASFMVYPNGVNLRKKNEDILQIHIADNMYAFYETIMLLSFLIFQYKMNDFEGVVKYCWKLLHFQADATAIEKATLQMTSLVSAVLCIPLWQRMHTFFSKYFFSRELSRNPSLSEFLLFELKPKCAHNFWRIINFKKSSSQLWRHSIIMLNHMIIQVNMDRYILVIRNGCFVLASPE